MTAAYDNLRRTTDYTWRDNSANGSHVLVGFTYDYDKVGNPLYEKFKHDEERYDNYRYDLLNL